MAPKYDETIAAEQANQFAPCTLSPLPSTRNYRDRSTVATSRKKGNSRSPYGVMINLFYENLWQCNPLVSPEKQVDEERQDLYTAQSDEDESTENEEILDTKAAPDVDEDMSVGSRSTGSASLGQAEADKSNFTLKDLLSYPRDPSPSNGDKQANSTAETTTLIETSESLLLSRQQSTTKNSLVATRNNMALIYAAAVKGKYHKNTADKLVKLGDVHFHQREHDRALECFDRAHHIYAVKLGDDSMESIETKVKIGGVQLALKRPDEAMNAYSLALRMTSHVLSGPQADIQVAYLSQEIALIQHGKGLHTNALKIMIQALRLYKKHYGDLHSTVAKAASEIGSLYHAMGENTKAVTLYTQVLKIQVGLWGKMHPDVAETLLQLAILYDEMGDVSRSMKIIKKSFLIFNGTVGEYHLSVARVLSHFGNLYTKTGRFSMAFKSYGKALHVRKSLLGRNHSLVADNLMDISYLFRTHGEPQEAMLCMTEALDIYKKSLGEDHVTTSDVLNSMGMTCYDMGDCDKAIRMYSQSLNIRVTAVGENHPSVANVFNNIGTAYSRIKEFEKALHSYNTALQIYEKLPARDHLKCCVTLVNIGTVRRGTGEYEKAEHVFKKALDISFDDAMLDGNHPVVQKAYRSLKAMKAPLYRISDSKLSC